MSSEWDGEDVKHIPDHNGVETGNFLIAQNHVQISKNTDFKDPGQTNLTFQTYRNEIGQGKTAWVEDLSPKGLHRESMTQERGDKPVEMHERNGNHSNPTGQSTANDDKENKENFGDEEEKEEIADIDNIPQPSTQTEAMGNVRSDTPIVPGVFSRKIMAKASDNIRNSRNMDKDLSDISRTHSRRNHVSHVPVSSRVSILCNNNLIKKYIGNDVENILERIYKQREGMFGGGMRKAYSNVDLTNIDLSQTFENPLSNNGKSSSFSTADKKEQRQPDASPSESQGHSPGQGRLRRRHSSISSGQEVQDIVEECYRNKREITINGQQTNTGTRSLNRGKQQRFNVPSFSEFRKMRQRRIASGHQYAKQAQSLLNDNLTAVDTAEVSSSKEVMETSILVTTVSSENSNKVDELQPITENEQKIEPENETLCQKLSGESQNQKDLARSHEQNATLITDSLEDTQTCDNKHISTVIKEPGDVTPTSTDCESPFLKSDISGEVNSHISDVDKISQSVNSVEDVTGEEKEQSDEDLCVDNNSEIVCNENIPREGGDTPVSNSILGETTPVTNASAKDVTGKEPDQSDVDLCDNNKPESIHEETVPRESGETPVSCSNSGEVTPVTKARKSSSSDKDIPQEVVLALMGSSMETQMSDDVFDDETGDRVGSCAGDNGLSISGLLPPGVEVSDKHNSPTHMCNNVLINDSVENEPFSSSIEQSSSLSNQRDCGLLPEFKTPDSMMDVVDMSDSKTEINETPKPKSKISETHDKETEISHISDSFVEISETHDSETEISEKHDSKIGINVTSNSVTVIETPGSTIDKSGTSGSKMDTFMRPDSNVNVCETPDSNITDISDADTHKVDTSVDSETYKADGKSEENETNISVTSKDVMSALPRNMEISVSNLYKTDSGPVERNTDVNTSTKPSTVEKPKALPRTPKRSAKSEIRPRPVPRARPVNDPSRSQVVQTGIRPQKRKLPQRPQRKPRTESAKDLKPMLFDSQPVLLKSLSVDGEQKSKDNISNLKSSSPEVQKGGNDSDISDPPTPPLPFNPPPVLPVPPLPASPPPKLFHSDENLSALPESAPETGIKNCHIPFSGSPNETRPFQVLEFSSSENSTDEKGTFYFPENPFLSGTSDVFPSLSPSASNRSHSPLFVFPEPLQNTPLSDHDETEHLADSTDLSFQSTSESDTTQKSLPWLQTSLDNIYRSNEELQEGESNPDPGSIASTFDLSKSLNVYRSSSDVSDSTPEALRKRRERRERPYKSDPFTGGKRPSPGRFVHFPGRHRSNPSDDGFNEDFGIEEVDEGEEVTFAEMEAERNRKRQIRMSIVSDASTDSGVIGQEVPPSPTGSNGSCGFSVKIGDSGSKITSHDEENEDTGDSMVGTLQGKEVRKTERKDIIYEIHDTELSYGRDLKILKEHFYKPMKSNGLLSSDQLESIFLNLEELMNVNNQFTAHLSTAVQDAVNTEDHDFSSIGMGDLFLNSSDLMMAFESYCINQGQAAILLEQLEKEKELLRIFLQVSQDDNPILRRMPLKSFLIIPVQRIMKYPLLLERLYKSTPSDNPDKKAILEAKGRLEGILGHINSKTKSCGSMKLKRKVAELLLQRQIPSVEKSELNRAAIDILGWNKKDVCEIMTCRLHVAMAAEQTWASKRLKNLKFSLVHGILLTLGQGEMHKTDDDSLLFPCKYPVIQAAVVLLKEKNGKYQTLREPFMLNRCIVNDDLDDLSVFELLENNKEPFLFKGDDSKEVKLWLRNVKQQTLDLGTWRKRRNALPNIMIKHLV